jgi:hypothetical protein
MQDDVSGLVGIEGLVVTDVKDARCVLVVGRGADCGGGLLSMVRSGIVGGQGAAAGAGA